MRRRHSEFRLPVRMTQSIELGAAAPQAQRLCASLLPLRLCVNYSDFSHGGVL
jgi:hypothetical protein